MLDDIEKVEEFIEQTRILHRIGLNERRIARQFGLWNDRGEPSIAKLRLFYSFAARRLKQTRDRNYIDLELEEILKIASQIEQMGETDERDEILSELRRCGFRTLTILKGEQAFEFNRYLEENEPVYTSYVLV